MMKFSIIIPAYNVENWIDDCIRSCINQDLVLGEDYEIIVVDDGSKDNTKLHLNAYKDIIVVEQENSGVSAARNNGLLHARGEYIWFIDGDDYIESNILGSLYQYIKSKDLDILNIAFKRVSDKVVFTNQLMKQPENSNTFIPILHGNIDQMVACNTIARLDYIKSHNIQFKEGMRYGEDTLWAFWMQLFAPKQEQIFNQIYFYRVRSGSAMQSESLDSRLKWLDSMFMMHDTYIEALNLYSNQLSKEKLRNIQERIYWNCQNLLFGALRLDKKKREQVLFYLESKKHYPYPILWNRLTLKLGLNNFLINLISLLFPFKSYYLALCWIYDKFKR